MRNEEKIIRDARKMCDDTRDLASEVRDLRMGIEDMLCKYGMLKREYAEVSPYDFNEEVVREEDLAILQDLENLYNFMETLENI